MYIVNIETVGGTSVSSDSWGEDSYCELADAVHFHVASSALKIKRFKPRDKTCGFFFVSIILNLFLCRAAFAFSRQNFHNFR